MATGFEAQRCKILHVGKNPWLGSGTPSICFWVYLAHLKNVSRCCGASGPIIKWIKTGGPGGTQAGVWGQTDAILILIWCQIYYRLKLWQRALAAGDLTHIIIIKIDWNWMKLVRICWMELFSVEHYLSQYVLCKSMWRSRLAFSSPEPKPPGSRRNDVKFY